MKTKQKIRNDKSKRQMLLRRKEKPENKRSLIILLLGLKLKLVKKNHSKIFLKFHEEVSFILLFIQFPRIFPVIKNLMNWGKQKFLMYFRKKC